MFKRICGLALLAFGMAILLGLMVERRDAGTAKTPAFRPPARVFAMRPPSQCHGGAPAYRTERQGAQDDGGVEAFAEKAPASVQVCSDSNGRTLDNLCYYRAAYTAFRLTDSAG